MFFSVTRLLQGSLVFYGGVLSKKSQRKEVYRKTPYENKRTNTRDFRRGRRVYILQGDDGVRSKPINTLMCVLNRW